MKTIRYAEDTDTGLIVSKCGGDFAWPIMEYDKIGGDGDFTKPIEYKLERVSMSYFYACPSAYRALRFMAPGKIPLAIRNAHRAFFGMKAIS